MKRRHSNTNRSLRLESLENRELLAVSLLGAPVEGHAATGSPTEIRFDLSTSNEGYSRLDFVVEASGALDPSALLVVETQTGRTITLSNIVDGTGKSGASALLTAGTYSVYVGADQGQGSFSLDILHDETPSQADSGLLLLVEAALAQQQSGWSSRKDFYNKLLAAYPEYATPLNGRPVKEIYPQVDVNGDGVVDSKDYETALQIISGSVVTPSIKTTPIVINPDTTGPTITAGLKNDTGKAGDGITIDTTVVGRITDSSGIQWVRYRLDSGSWLAVKLDSTGNFTIPNQNVTAGTHTITIAAMDNVGKKSSVVTTFVYPEASTPGGTGGTISDGGTGTVSLGNGFSVSTVDGVKISSGKTITLPGEKGTVKLNADGTLTFTPGADYDRLAEGEKENVSFSVVSRDEHGREFRSTVSFQITGRNDLPFLRPDATTPALTLNEGTSGTIGSNTILAGWTDVDNGARLSVVQPRITKSVCSNTSLNSTYSIAALAPYLTFGTNGVTFDASSDFFRALGKGETLTITVSYDISDGIGTSTHSGTLTFTILGQDNPSILTASVDSFRLPSNDMKNPVKSIDPKFSVTDPDRKDAAGFVYSVVSVREGSKGAGAGLITGFDSKTGTFQIDTAQLSNRNSKCVVTVVVAVTSASGGVVERTLTVTLEPLAAPAASSAFRPLETETVQATVAPTVPGSQGFSLGTLKLVDGTLPAGMQWQDYVALDSGGRFRFDPGDDFEYLHAGETLELRFEYAITDKQYGLSGTGTITLEIVGVATSATAPTPPRVPVGTGGAYSSREQNGTAAALTATKTDLLERWSLPETRTSYEIVIGGISFDNYNGTTTNPLSGVSNWGTVRIDSSGGIVFTPTKKIYQSLGEGEWIDLVVDYSVRNIDGGDPTPGGKVVFRILGSNDAPTLEVNENIFHIATNPLEEIETIGAVFTPDDVDWNNRGTFAYAFDGNAHGFEIDARTGIVSVTKEAAGKLKDGTYALTAVVTDRHGATAKKTIQVVAARQPNPVIPGDRLRLEMSENDTLSKNLNELFVAETGHSYAISGVVYSGCEGKIPAGADPSTLFRFDGTDFTFAPGTAFDAISLGETLTLNFRFTVTDTGFSNCSTTATFSVVVRGVNDDPTYRPGDPLRIDASVKSTIDWQRFFSDVDRNDTLRLSKIDGKTFLNGKITTGDGVFEYDAKTAVLTFTPSKKYDSLEEGATVTLPGIVLTVVDGNGGAVEGSIDIEIRGVNKAPLLRDTTVTADAAKTAEISLDEPGMISDENTKDVHSIVSVTVDGRTYDFKSGRTVTLDTGTKITLSADGRTLVADASNRTAYTTNGKPETVTMTVRVSDNSGADNHGATATWTVEIESEPPCVAGKEIKGIAENNKTVPDDVVLDGLITDSNYPFRSGTSDWYTVSIPVLKATIGGKEISLEKYDTIRGFWKFEDGALKFDAPNGYFDFLAQGETLVLTFSYTVTDKYLKDQAGNFLASEGIVTLEIDGVNNRPVVVAPQTSFTLTNSGLADDAEIFLADFEYTDLDGRPGESYCWAIENLDARYGNLFVIDPESGRLVLDNALMPDLAPGASSTFEFDVVVSDGNGGAGEERIFVTVFAKKRPEIAIADFDLTESENMDESRPITVTDPEEGDSLEQRTGDDWYDEPRIDSVKAPEEYADLVAGRFTEQEFMALFRIEGDAEHGYSLRFLGTKEQFKFLNEKERLSLDVTIAVRDAQYDVTRSETVRCTINGVGDPASVTVATGRELEFWSNDGTMASREYKPQYNVVDPDHDEGQFFGFGGISGDELPDGFDPDRHVEVDAATGAVTIHREGWTGLAQNATYTLTILVTGENDGIAVPVTLTLNVYVAKSPIVSPTEKRIDEAQDVRETIVVSKPNDGAERSVNDWYSIGDPTLISADGVFKTGPEDLPEGYIVKIENGIFVFETGCVFDHLGRGESVTFVFGFTVTDDRYGVTADSTYTVIVSGKNTAPQGKSDLSNFDAGTIGGEAIALGTLRDLIDDVDRNDRHVLLSIDNVDVEYDRWLAVAGKGEFYFDTETEILSYRPSADAAELLKIKHDAIESLTFEFVVRDDSGDEATHEGNGSFQIDVKGTNGKPEIIAERTTLVGIEEGESAVNGKAKSYDASYFATDRNGDTLRFYSIAGTVLDPAGDTQTIRLDDGTRIVVSNDRRTITIDTSRRKENMKGIETYDQSFYVVIEDGSGALNDKTDVTSIQFVIRGINDAPVMPDCNFGVSIDEHFDGAVGTVDLTDVDTDRNDYEFNAIRKADISIVDASPGVDQSKIPQFTIWDNGKIVVDKSNLPNLEDDEFITYTFVVKAGTEDGETAEATITVTFGKKSKPAVELPDGDTIVVSETGNDEGTGVGIDVEDPTGEDRRDDWYAYHNVRFVEGTISGRNDFTGAVVSLPYGAEFGIENDRFYFHSHGSFDFLGAGETATLTFEFTVKDVANRVDTVQTLTVVVQGENSRPTAGDERSKFDIPVGSQDGYKFYLSQIASDADLRDKLRFASVNGKAIDFGSPVSIVEQDGDGGEILIGEVRLGHDGNDYYLHFIPSADFHRIRHQAVKEVFFTYTVTDDSAVPALSNEGTLGVGLIGRNRTPVFKDDLKLETTEDAALDIKPSDVATDPNGDPIRIVSVRVDDGSGNKTTYEINRDKPTAIRLPSGAELTLTSDGRLKYDPAGRSVNLKFGETDEERFEIRVADDLDLESSRTDWKEIRVDLTGVNESPVDLLPGRTVYSAPLGGTIEINLDEHFRDADGDSLTVSFQTEGGMSETLSDLGFIERCYFETVDGERRLTIVFKSKDMYGNEFDFTERQLTLSVTDGRATIVKTLTIQADPTVRLDVSASRGEAAPGESYSVRVDGRDLINDLMENDRYGHGLYGIEFVIYFDPDLCDIGAYRSIGSVEKFDHCLFVSIDGATVKELADRFDVELLTFSVTPKTRESDETASFWIGGNVVVTRTDGQTLVDPSQVGKGSVEVRHLAPVVPVAAASSIVVGSSAPSADMTFSTCAMPRVWTAEDETACGAREAKHASEEIESIDQAFADDDLFGGPTGSSAGCDCTDALADTRFSDGEWEEILAALRPEPESVAA